MRMRENERITWPEKKKDEAGAGVTGAIELFWAHMM